jgi:hypothetical protein
MSNRPVKPADGQMSFGFLCQEGKELRARRVESKTVYPAVSGSEDAGDRATEETALAPDLAALEGDPAGNTRADSGDDFDRDPADGVELVRRYSITPVGTVYIAPDRWRRTEGLVFASDLAGEGIELLRGLRPGADWTDRLAAMAKLTCAHRAVEQVYGAHFRGRKKALTLLGTALEELDCGNVVGATAYVEVTRTLIVNRLARIRKAEQKTGRQVRPRRKNGKEGL